MLVSPRRAQRCIRSFNGTILFLPCEATSGILEGSRFYNTKIDTPAGQEERPEWFAKFEIFRLDLLGYYFLVLLTLTGLSTLLGFTDVVDVRENIEGLGESSSDDDKIPGYLKVDNSIIQFLNERSGGQTVRMIRRFEFKFRLVGIHVAMMHYASKNDKLLHLVEVYKLSSVANIVVKCFNFLAQSFSPILPPVILAAYMIKRVLRLVRNGIEYWDNYLIAQETKQNANDKDS